MHLSGTRRILCFLLSIQRDLAGLGETLKDINPHTYPRTVIFCSRKSTVSSVFQFLRQCAKDKRCVAMYHASLTEATKRDIYEQFSNPLSYVCCLVATIAFGMVSYVHICTLNICIRNLYYFCSGC